MDIQALKGSNPAASAAEAGRDVRSGGDVRRAAEATPRAGVAGESGPAGRKATVSGRPVEQAAPAVQQDVEALRQAADAVNGDPRLRDRNLGFRVDEELGRTLISVVDLETEETVRQIPPEEFVELARRLQEFQESFESAVDPTPPAGSVISLDV